VTSVTADTRGQLCGRLLPSKCRSACRVGFPADILLAIFEKSLGRCISHRSFPESYDADYPG
jgi:hypothetical protein